jgi:ABC-2 type transport system ATP-binding protein
VLTAAATEPPFADRPATTLSAPAVTAGYRGTAVLPSVSVDYGAGMHVLLDPNGAGKTTLFRVLAGILPPRAGRVLIADRDPHADPGARLVIAIAPRRQAPPW